MCQKRIRSSRKSLPIQESVEASDSAQLRIRFDSDNICGVENDKRYFMKLVTFQGASREKRIGALAAEGWIIDLNAAYASYLRNVEREGASIALADARVPPHMRGLFENGNGGVEAARA